MNDQPINKDRECRIDIKVQADDFDLTTEAAALTDGHTGIGAMVTFTGLCRDEGGQLTALELEHYPGMAQHELTTIARHGRAGNRAVRSASAFSFGWRPLGVGRPLLRGDFHMPLFWLKT